MFYFGLHNQRFGWWQHLRHAAFLGMHDSVQGSSANVLTGGKVTFGTAGFDLQYDTASFISNPIVSSKQWRENISTENKARQLIFCEQSIKVVFIYGMPFFCVALFGFPLPCVFFLCVIIILILVFQSVIVWPLPTFQMIFGWWFMISWDHPVPWLLHANSCMRFSIYDTYAAVWMDHTLCIASFLCAVPSTIWSFKA